MPPQSRLPFERDIQEMEDLLARLESGGDGKEGTSEEIRRIRRELVSMKKKIYSNLSAWQTVLVSRHEDRPQTLDYVNLIFEEFVEIHGDRAIGNDRALVVLTERGRDVLERNRWSNVQRDALRLAGVEQEFGDRRDVDDERGRPQQPETRQKA